MNLSGHALRVGVNKHRTTALAKGFRQLRRKLLTGDNFDAFSGERLGNQAGSVPAHRVVAA
jgi:hypothetical protein